jgi:hypothetical protein
MQYKKNKKKIKKILTKTSIWTIIIIETTRGDGTMKLTTLKGQPVTERFAARRETYFAGIDDMTDAQIERLSIRWHRLGNRYQRLIARVVTRQQASAN